MGNLQQTFLGRWDEAIPNGVIIAACTIDLNQAADVYTLFTAKNQNLLIERLVIRLPNVDCSDDGSLTSISIHTSDTTAYDFIDTTAGDVANLTAEAVLPWEGAAMLKVGKSIQLTIAGGAADEATVCNVIVAYRPAAMGGYMALASPSASASSSPSASVSSSPSASVSASPSSSPS